MDDRLEMLMLREQILDGIDAIVSDYCKTNNTDIRSKADFEACLEIAYDLYPITTTAFIENHSNELMKKFIEKQ